MNFDYTEDMTPINALMPDMEQIGEVMPGGFFIYYADEKEELIHVNRVMLDIFGCKNKKEFKELTGNTFKGLVYPEDLDKIQSSIDDQVESHLHGLDHVVYRIRRKDGKIRWIDDHGRKVMTSEFGLVYYVLIRDITEEHEAMEELERLKEENAALKKEIASLTNS